MSLSHATKIEWTPELIAEQQARNAEREQRLREQPKKPARRFVKSVIPFRPKPKPQPEPTPERRLRKRKWHKMLVPIEPSPPKPQIPRSSRRRLPKTPDALPKETGFVYLIAFEGLYKIGMTNNIGTRMRALERKWHMAAGSYKIIHTVHSPDMIYLEALLHKRFAVKNVHAEWFDLGADDVAWIIGLGSKLDEMQIAILAM